MIQKGSAILEKFTLRTQRGKIRLEGSDYHDLLNQLRTLDGIPEANLMDFRRGGEKVKQAILGSIAALYDAKITPADTIPILGYGSEGSYSENLLYFNDYIEHGRDGGRGQLFVGTLPTTPLCEVAIALKMHGPAFYLDSASDRKQLHEEQELLFADPAVSEILLLEFKKGTLHVSCLGRGKEEEEEGKKSCDF